MFRKALCLVALAACAFLMSPNANAGLSIEPVGVGVHVGSHHFPSQSWNNSNPGLYLMADVKGPAWITGAYAVGTYYNSERKQSAYVARVFNVYGPIDVAVGVISGYSRSPVLPLVVPSVRLDIGDNWAGRVHFLPKVEKSGSYVVHFSVERKF